MAEAHGGPSTAAAVNFGEDFQRAEGLQGPQPGSQLGPQLAAAVEAQVVNWLHHALLDERREVDRLLKRRHDDLLMRLQRLPTQEVRGEMTRQPLVIRDEEPPVPGPPSDKLQVEACIPQSPLAPAGPMTFRPAVPEGDLCELLTLELEALKRRLLTTLNSTSSAGQAANGHAEKVQQKAEVPAEQNLEQEPPQKTEAERRASAVRKVDRGLNSVRSKTSIFGDEAETPVWKENLANILDATSIIVICLNIFLLAFQTEYTSFDLSYGLRHVEGFEDSQPSLQAWPGADITVKALELLFGCFFCGELAIRFIFRINLRKDICWNLLDTLVVAAWVIEQVQPQGLINPGILRMVRLVRLLRGMRFIHNHAIFHPFHLMVKAIQSSMSCLMWTVSILFLLMMVAAMVNTFILESFIKDTSQTDQARRDIYMNWGSFNRAYVSMFEITLANWGPQCWQLMDNVHESWGIFFILWRCCFGFAVIQVITSVFIQHTFKVASQDEELMIQTKQGASKSFLKHLDKLFSDLDESGDGQISREEFEAALTQPRVRHWFGALEIDVSDLPLLFQMLDDGDGQICKEEFIDGLKKFKGVAQSMDMLALRKDMQRLLKANVLQGPGSPRRSARL